MISVIIPAHNEEKVIAATIKELVGGVAGGELEIIVVCNGCTDNTAKVVAGFGDAVKCLVTQLASKTKALNLGDATAVGFPRIYQDADVILSLASVRQLASVLISGRFLAAAPKMRMNLQKSSWFVSSYYDVWQELPYVKEGMIGTGAFALSEEGRKRFNYFPEIIADDGYIRALFKTHERTSVESAQSLVRAPANIEGLLKIKTRSRLGGIELKRKFPELRNNEEKNYGIAVWSLLRQLSLWPKVPVYLYVNVISRYRAKVLAKTKGFIGWERDDSSRENL